MSGTKCYRSHVDHGKEEDVVGFCEDLRCLSPFITNYHDNLTHIVGIPKLPTFILLAQKLFTHGETSFLYIPLILLCNRGPELTVKTFPTLSRTVESSEGPKYQLLRVQGKNVGSSRGWWRLVVEEGGDPKIRVLVLLKFSWGLRLCNRR